MLARSTRDPKIAMFVVNIVDLARTIGEIETLNISTFRRDPAADSLQEQLRAILSSIYDCNRASEVEAPGLLA